MDGSFNQELERRTAQFARQLAKMQDRCRIDPDSTGFCIVGEAHSDSKKPLVGKARQSLKVTLTLAVGAPLGGFALGDGYEADDGSKGDVGPKRLRFVQFAFLRNYFLMDLPISTLTQDEARRLMRDRPGFFWLKDRPGMPDVPTSPRGATKWNPLCKAYLYGDEGLAAADAAHLFFSIWNFPVDCPLYLTAFSRGPSKSFEKDLPLT